jgi:hypothetical protein
MLVLVHAEPRAAGYRSSRHPKTRLITAVDQSNDEEQLQQSTSLKPINSNHGNRWPSESWRDRSVYGSEVNLDLENGPDLGLVSGVYQTR